MQEFDQALERAIEQVLGPQAAQVRARVLCDESVRGMAYGQAALIWMDRNMPAAVPEVLRVARIPEGNVR